MAASLLAACGPRDAAYDTSSFTIRGVIVPREVALIDDDANPLHNTGLFTEGPSTIACCWIAPQATLFVRKHAPAKTLLAGFWVPNFKRFANGQSVTILLPGGKPFSSGQLEANYLSAVRVPVPASLRARTGYVPVRITTGIDYVPARDEPPSSSLLRFLRPHGSGDTSSDTRKLGIVLLYLYFE